MVAQLVAGSSVALAAEPGTATPKPPAAWQIGGIRADGKPVAAIARRGGDDVIELSSRPQHLLIEVGAPTRDAAQPTQLRYRLDGHDEDWRDPDAVMRFQVRFVDAESRPVDGVEFPARGASPGWTGRIETAPFVTRTARMTVPARSARVLLWMPSAGPQETTGVRVFSAIRISVDGPGGPRPIFESDFEKGADLDSPSGVPDGWARDGTNPGIGQVVQLPGDPVRHALGIIDDDPAGLGGWVMGPAIAPPVTPGETLLVEWSEAYHVGAGGRFAAVYERLPPGRYRFRVMECSLFGMPTGRERSLVIEIPPPFWASKAFAVLAATGAAGLVLLSMRRITRRRMERQLAASEQRRLLEADRTRIARDLHDDLGATLTRIGLLSELARAEGVCPEESRRYLDQIFENATATTRQLNEIVWAISPQNDHIERFSGYLCKFAQDYLGLANVRCRIDLPDRLPDVPLSSAVRHNLFLATKEAINNAVKHARAGTISLQIRCDGRELAIRVVDDGVGFAGGLPRPSGGKGFDNMADRMRQIDGRFSCTSRPGQGTTMTFTVPLGESATRFLGKAPTAVRPPAPGITP